MSELFPDAEEQRRQPNLAEMMAEVARELRMRSKVYPGRVSRHDMTRAAAERQVAHLEAVYWVLEQLQGDREWLTRHGIEP
jgi:hypothetical protein